MCPTWHFVYIFFNPVFQVSTAKNEINLFNNHILIVAPVTFAPAGAMTPSAEFLFIYIYSRLSLSQIPRDSLKYFEISVPRHIRVERVKKTINWTITFNKWMCNLTPKVRKIYIKWCGKEEKLLLRSSFSFFPHYFVTCCHSFMLKQGPDFHFEISGNLEISEFEITRFDCIYIFFFW